MYGTIWALLPPVVAIVLALITKEVYSSLFIGIVTGALIYTGFSPIATLDTVINEGFINSVADAWNIGIFMLADNRMLQLILRNSHIYVPDPVGYHGSTDEQGRRLCSLRRMGEKACKDQSGSAAFHLFIRCSDFRG